MNAKLKSILLGTISSLATLSGTANFAQAQEKKLIHSERETVTHLVQRDGDACPTKITEERGKDIYQTDKKVSSKKTAEQIYYDRVSARAKKEGLTYAQMHKIVQAEEAEKWNKLKKNNPVAANNAVDREVEKTVVFDYVSALDTVNVSNILAEDMICPTEEPDQTPIVQSKPPVQYDYVEKTPEKCDTTINVLVKKPGPRFYGNVGGGPISVTPQGGDPINGMSLSGNVGVSVPMTKNLSWDTDIWGELRWLKNQVNDTVLTTVKRDFEDEVFDVRRTSPEKQIDARVGVKTGPNLQVWKDAYGAGSVSFRPFVGVFAQAPLTKVEGVSLYDDVTLPYETRFTDGPRVGWNYGAELNFQPSFKSQVKPRFAVGIEKAHLFGSPSTTPYLPYNATTTTLVNPDPFKNTMNLYAKVGIGIGGSTTKRDPVVVQGPNEYEKAFYQSLQQNSVDTTQQTNAVDTPVQQTPAVDTSANNTLNFLDFEMKPMTPHTPVKSTGYKAQQPNELEKLGDYLNEKAEILGYNLNNLGHTLKKAFAKRQNPYACARI